MTNLTTNEVEKLLVKYLTPFHSRITAIEQTLKRLVSKLDPPNGHQNVGTLDNSVVLDSSSSEQASLTSSVTKSPIVDKITTAVEPVPNKTVVSSARSQRANARYQRNITSETITSNSPSSNPAGSTLSTTPSNTKTLSKSTSISNKKHSSVITNNSINNDEATSMLTAADQADETPWKTVQKRKTRRRVIRGSGSTDDNLEAVERVKRIHVCFLKPDTTADDLKDYMVKKQHSTGYTVQKLTLKHNHYASFAITIPSSLYEFFMSPANWPQQVEISPWFRKSVGRAARSSPYPGSRTQTTGASTWTTTPRSPGPRTPNSADVVSGAHNTS